MTDRAISWRRNHQWRLSIGVMLALLGLYFLVPALQAAIPALIFLPLLVAAGGVAFFAGRKLGETLGGQTSRKPAKLQAESWGSPAGIEKMLDEHMARLANLFRGRPGEGEAQTFLDGAMEDRLLSFAVDAVHRNIPDAMLGAEIRHDSQMFPEWFVAVTVCPWLLPEEVKPHLDGGYLNLINTLSGPAVNMPGGRNILHWIYCYDGIHAAAHVSLMPNPQAPGHNPAVIAQDLLTAEERRQVGLLPE
jgi:hypothetical protein